MEKVKAIAIKQIKDFKTDPMWKSYDAIIAMIGGIFILWTSILLGSVAYAGTIRVLSIASNIISN